MPSENDGGAIFWSPQKIQSARDLLYQKDEEAAQEQARKDDKKLQQQLAKQAEEAQKAERAQIRREKQEQRVEKAVEKQRLKDEQDLTKLADLQLQNEIQPTPCVFKRQKNQFPKKSIRNKAPKGVKQVDEVAPTINHRGRQIRLPERFRE